jgi:hypothetical protein
LVCFTAACELSGTYLASIGQNNQFVLHIYNFGASLFLGFFFYELFGRLGWPYWKKSYIYLGSALILLGTFTLGDIYSVNTITQTSFQVFIIGLSLVAYTLLTLREYAYTDRGAVVLFLAGILLQNSGSIIVYLFVRQILQLEGGLPSLVYTIVGVANIVAQTLYFLGFVQIVKESRHQQSNATSHE